ncbi:enoyl-CoA hydratase-related protein [Bacillus sp. FSL W7-1360]
MYDYIDTSVTDGVARIELNRPNQFNALNRAMVKEIVSALTMYDRDDEVRVLMLTGKGRAFSAGADIDEMVSETPVSLELLNQFADWDQFASLKKPLIGAVHGYVFGGGFELALCCDLLIAAEGTTFAFPEVNLGVMPGAGGTQRLTKLIGRTRALRWLLTGERMAVEEAKACGIVIDVVHPEALESEAHKYATTLAAKPPLSLRMIKDAVNYAVDVPLREGMGYERKNFYALFASEDQTEGMCAFVDKRTPQFKGK